jgi:hypothetical protein
MGVVKYARHREWWANRDARASRVSEGAFREIVRRWRRSKLWFRRLESWKQQVANIIRRFRQVERHPIAAEFLAYNVELDAAALVSNHSLQTPATSEIETHLLSLIM